MNYVVFFDGKLLAQPFANAPGMATSVRYTIDEKGRPSLADKEATGIAEVLKYDRGVLLERRGFWIKDGFAAELLGSEAFT